MGSSRALYAKFSEKLPLLPFMGFCGFLCLISYLLAALSPLPAMGLLGCALCGLSVGILWPGSFSLAAGALKGGGTAMFAFLALAGDVGCSAGPSLVGFVSGLNDGNMKAGILGGIVFPVLLILTVGYLKKN